MRLRLGGSPRFWAPVAILGAAVLVASIVIATRPELEPKREPEFAPLVQVLEVNPEPVRFTVRTQGAVVPRRESDLVPQVSGEVVWTSPDLVSGGFFEEGQPLVRIERADYEADLESARAALARARSEFHRAEKERSRQRSLADRSVASQARIDDTENEYQVADAALREARARLGRAERDLERTELRAPYEGRVRSKSVDAGQFVTRGQAIARLYAVDYAEVRLPLPDRELRYLDLSLGPETAAPPDADAPDPEAEDGEAASAPTRPAPAVTLKAEFAGRPHVWTGEIVRTEGEIDPRSRMINVVARVEDPYGRHEGGDSEAPLAVGLFVDAEIAGREVPQAIRVPRMALRRGEDGTPSRVWVVGDDARLAFRSVELLRVDREEAVIGDGLAPGERVVVSAIRGAVDGMRVRVEGAPQPVARVDGEPTGEAK